MLKSYWNYIGFLMKCNKYSCSYSPKGEPEKSKGTNIIAILPGTKWGTPEDEVIVVGAHWDSVETSPGKSYIKIHIKRSVKLKIFSNHILFFNQFYFRI